MGRVPHRARRPGGADRWRLTSKEEQRPWARAHGRPVFLGEFGTTSNADLASRVRWTRCNRELAEQHGFAWGCWSYGPSFALWDADHHRWHTELLQALIPWAPQRGRL